MSLHRRQFITLLGGAAAAWPLSALAQQAKVPVIGMLYAGVPETSAALIEAFRKGLGESGYVEGRNVAIEYRWARNDFSKLPGLVQELVSRQVAVIATPQSAAAGLAAKSVTATVPVVFSAGGDPVSTGLVESLNRPGGNVTGINSMNNLLAAKRVGLLRELVPDAARIAFLAFSGTADLGAQIADMTAAAASIGRQAEVLTASTNSEIDAAFAAMVQKRCDAVVVAPSSLFTNRATQLVSLAARHGIPAIYSDRDIVDLGGLMSYGSSVPDLFRQVAIYAGRILKGEKPADMPVLRASKFELVVNVQAAKTLGIPVPPTLSAIADEIIE
jgi:putative ABC transport system substrate-binding protein